MSLNSSGYRYGLPLASEEASIRPEFFVKVEKANRVKKSFKTQIAQREIARARSSR